MAPTEPPKILVRDTTTGQQDWRTIKPKPIECIPGLLPITINPAMRHAVPEYTINSYAGAGHMKRDRAFMNRLTKRRNKKKAAKARRAK